MWSNKEYSSYVHPSTVSTETIRTAERISGRGMLPLIEFSMEFNKKNFLVLNQITKLGANKKGSDLETMDVGPAFRPYFLCRPERPTVGPVHPK
jgi:hypothetical protein